MRLRLPLLALVTLLAGCGRGGALRPGAVFDHKSFAFAVASAPGGDVLCALLEGGRYKLTRFDGKTGARRSSIDVAAAEAWIYDLALSDGGQRAALAARQLRGATARPSSKLLAAGLVTLVDLPGARVLARHALPRPARAVRFIADGALAVGLEATPDTTERGLLCRLDPAAKTRRCVAAHEGTVSAIARSGDLLVTGSWDRTVRLWRADLTAATRAQLRVGGVVNALDARGDLLAVATSAHPPRRNRARVAAEARGEHRRGERSGAVELWHVPSRTRRYRAVLHHVATSAVALVRAGRAGQLPLVASGGWDFRVLLSRGSKVLARLDGLSQIVTGLATSGRGVALSAWTENGAATPSCAVLEIRDRL